MFSKILKSKRMIQSLEIKYVPQNMNKSLEIKISKLNDCQKD